MKPFFCGGITDKFFENTATATHQEQAHRDTRDPSSYTRVRQNGCQLLSHSHTPVAENVNLRLTATLWAWNLVSFHKQYPGPSGQLEGAGVKFWCASVFEHEYVVRAESMSLITWRLYCLTVKRVTQVCTTQEMVMLTINNVCEAQLYPYRTWQNMVLLLLYYCSCIAKKLGTREVCMNYIFPMSPLSVLSLLLKRGDFKVLTTERGGIIQCGGGMLRHLQSSWPKETWEYPRGLDEFWSEFLTRDFQ